MTRQVLIAQLVVYTQLQQTAYIDSLLAVSIFKDLERLDPALLELLLMELL